MHIIGGYTAHTEQMVLVAFMVGVLKGPVEICFVHSDPVVKQQLAGVLCKRCSDSIAVVEIVIP